MRPPGGQLVAGAAKIDMSKLKTWYEDFADVTEITRYGIRDTARVEFGIALSWPRPWPMGIAERGRSVALRPNGWRAQPPTQLQLATAIRRVAAGSCELARGRGT